jgi:hypothetical protein
MSAGTPKEKKLPAPLTEEREAELRAMKPIDRFTDTSGELKEHPGWAPIPHLRNELCGKVGGHVQSILLDEIMHVIFDRKGAKKEALIKFSVLEKKWQYTRKAFQLALDDGFDRRLIRRRRAKNEKGIDGKHWLCWVVPEDWPSVKPYERKPNPTGTPTVRDANGRYCLGAEPIRLVDELLDGIDPTTVSVVAVTETSSPITLTWERAGSVVSVVARDAAPAAPQVPEGSVLAPNVPKYRLDFTAIRPLFASFHAVLDAKYLKRFRKLPDDGHLADIISLMEGAPPEMLGVRLDQKIAARKWELSGLALDLARDCAAAWKREAADREAAAAEATARQRAEQSASARVEAAAAAERADTTPWGTIRRAIKQQIDPGPYENWFVPTKLLRIDGDALIVEVPDKGSCIYLADEYQALADRMAVALNAGFVRVVFVADPLSDT